MLDYISFNTLNTRRLVKHNKSSGGKGARDDQGRVQKARQELRQEMTDICSL